MKDPETGDSLKIKPVPAKNGGARPGSGRKKGQLAPQTIERAKVLKAYRDRVAGLADELLDHQLILARGCTVLYRVEKDAMGQDKKPIMVTSQSEVRDFLEGNYGGQRDVKYYFITTERPDSRTIDSMLDRTFGKADSKIDLTSQGERLQAAPIIISPIAPRDAPTQE
jgi:hypothetical protein